MEQIVFYGFGVLALVVSTVDAISDWLKELGVPPWLLVLSIFVFYVFDKWSTQLAGRVHAIEKKLGIEYQPPQRKKSAWWSLLAWFVVAVYILGKSFQAEGLVALGGFALSSFMLLLCAFCAYCFTDEAVRLLAQETGTERMDRQGFQQTGGLLKTKQCWLYDFEFVPPNRLNLSAALQVSSGSLLIFAIDSRIARCSCSL